jgi:flavodoxin
MQDMQKHQLGRSGLEVFAFRLGISRFNAMSRRNALIASMTLPWVAAPAFAIAQTDSARRQAGSKVLVAYFSRSGNTRVIAGQIRRARNADLFEIQPAAQYPEDYEETVAQAQRETSSSYEPPLKAKVTNMADYETVFLGFPIWGQTAPPVIRSFFSSHDLTGKTLIPFITHGGYGIGNSLSVLAARAPHSRLLDASFSIQADQERQTLTRVTRWLGEVQTKAAK